MNNKIEKTKITSIILVLILTISVLLLALPTISAQEPGTKQTYCYLGATPNPVGVNQEVLFHVGIFTPLTTVTMGWEDLSITIQRPDGETDTISNIRTDSTGGTGRVYVPTMTGTYTVQAHFPEQETTETNYARGNPIGTVMLESSSEELEIIVQEDQIEFYPADALPEAYWTRPIDAQHREWYILGGNWLELNRFRAPVLSGNEEAPESAHILWTKPLAMGGVAGGTDTGIWSFSHGDAYEGKWDSRLIINGILIHTERTNTLPLIYEAVDVRTGETLWTKTLLDNRTIAFGQTLLWDGYNHHGVYSYFYVTIGSTWYAFDPFTGNQEFIVTNVPSGTTVYGDKNWIYRYNFNQNTGQGYIWSLTQLIVPFGSDSPHAGSWPPGGSFYAPRYDTYDAAAIDEATGELTEDAQRAYISNFTFPTGLPGRVNAVALGDRAFGMSTSQTEVTTWAFSLEEGHEGEMIFNETWDAPSEWVDGDLTIANIATSLEDEVAVIWTQETRQHYGFSTEDGSNLWGPTESEHYQNYYGGHGGPKLIYDGKLFTTGVSGIVYCYDVTSGETVWTYEANDYASEFLFSNNWWQILLFITDGKVYLTHVEHSAVEPMPRGAPSLCLDADSGEVVWRADGLFRGTVWGGRAAIGDSVMVTYDTYDNRIYAVGKGPSQTTVSVAPKVVASGTSLIIEGYVTDVSPGTDDVALKLRFPNGVPVAADEEMSEWMKYVYKTFDAPEDVHGVEVVLSVQDPNGDGYSATVRTDETGRFSHMWTPGVVGEYEVTAIFEGSKSYYQSHATAAFGVDSAPTPATPIEPEEPETPEVPDEPTEPSEPVETPFITTEVAIIIGVVAVAAIAAVAFVLLRRRK